jgi:NADP-dependent alcohol dehydrogenase
MLNFELYNPTIYFFGKDKLKNYHVSTTRSKNPFGVWRWKHFQKWNSRAVINNLKGHEIVEFAGIEPNPF